MRIADARQVGKTSVGRLDPRLSHWILPTWFYQQADPHAPYFSNGDDFGNQTCQSWTLLRPEGSPERYAVDRYGVLTLGNGCSLEVWIYDGGQLITPAGYHRVEQQYCPECPGVITTIHTGALSASIRYNLTCGAIHSELMMLRWDSKSLHPIWILYVLRPFGNNGFAPLYQLEYRDSALWINRKRIATLEKEPSHSFFTNEATGDITRYFREGQGNSGSASLEGFCTGFIGYSGLPGEIPVLRMKLSRKGEVGGNHLKGKHRGGSTTRNIGACGIPMAGTVTTGTKWDGFLEVAFHHVKGFSPDTKVSPVTISQIITLNRFGFFERSASYLEFCLKKIRINGDFPAEFLGSEKWISAVADYYRLSGDVEWVKAHWSDIRKVSWHLLQNYDENRGIEFGAGDLWHCAAWRDLTELAEAVHELKESRIFKGYYFALLQKLFGMISKTANQQNSTMAGSRSREWIHLLEWFFPLHLWDERQLNAGWWLQNFEERYVREGGVFSPTEFKGIDLELTAKWCQYLLWAGQNYDVPLRLLLTIASGTWSWPDVVNPVSLLGIGKTGHDPSVLYQMVLLWRLMFIHEIGNHLYILPGIFNSSFWERSQIEMNQMATKFGKVSLSCQTVGTMTQITLDANYRQKPAKIRLKLNPSYRVIFADADVTYDRGILEADPGLQLIRLKKCII